MTRLFALVFALIVPYATRPLEGAVQTRGTHFDEHRKPFGDLVAEAAFDAACEFARLVRGALQDFAAVVQACVAPAIDPACPPRAAAPELAVAIARQAPAPPTLVEIARVVAKPARRIAGTVELRFLHRWEDPKHARMAASIFTGSLALACAGLVGIVTVAAPTPAVRLQSLAGAVHRAVESGATADTITPPPAVAAAATGDASENTKGKSAGKASPAAAAQQPAVTAPAPKPIPPAARGALPIGKGMWIWMESRADGGDPNAIVARAKAIGLTHLYVRTGTLKGGFIGGPFLDALLPVAHANGIRVYGWDFPYLNDPGSDVNRALAAIRHTTPDGHRIDGFSSDIESSREGTNNNLEYVTAYVTWLRDNVGPDYPLIATVPNPTRAKVAAGYPYATVVAPFDAVAPMVYWMNRDPGTDVANAVAYLSQFGKPVFPIGQAYDGGPEGGPPGVPGRDQIIRFMQFADAAGGAGASFWSYQHATQEVWDAVRDAVEFRLDLGGEGGFGLSKAMIRAYQVNLTSLGFPVPPDGVWSPATVDAVRAYQKAANLPTTGVIDAATRAFLLTPVAAPVKSA